MSNFAPAELRLYAAAFTLAWLMLAVPSAKAEDPPAAAAGAAPSSASISIASWGGAYGQSQEIAYFEPFTKKTGVNIKTETYDGTLAAIKAKISGGASAFDIVDLSQYALDMLCRDGLLETIDSATLAAGPGGQSVSEDFLFGGINSCGVASVAWSTAIAFDRQAFAKAQPSKIADLLDIQRFPGKRALPNGPRYTLELALLADGVEPANIYSELGTPVGADRAFAALDKIKPQILWWAKAEDATAMLMQRKASMAAGFSGRIFRAAVGARQRIDVLWDGQIYDLDLWAIPKGAANKEDAKRFIAFATEPAQMAAQAELIAYGPMRKSAIALVGKHPSIDIEMKGFLPTAPDNFKKALKFDEVWWKEHGAELESRFKTWRERPAVTDAKASPANGKSKPTDAKPSTADEKPKPGDAKAATADEKPKPAEAKPSNPEALTGSVPNAGTKPAPKPAPNKQQ
ncbi:MAG TPA: extracellular solute-binding protein [Methyloceanibacter sp.]|nr:extracellular solute-binding protein [Methyloceanibacter sp.]